MKLESEPSLCGKLHRLDNVASNAVMTNGSVTTVDALRALSRHQCAQDLVVEFLCAKVLPLRAN